MTSWLYSRVLIGSILVIFCQVVAAEPYVITFSKSNSAVLQVYQQPALSTESSTRIEEKLVGGESSQCRAYGRRSSTSAIVDAQLLAHREDGVSFSMLNNSNANGGHFRTCAQCLGGNCIGVFGNDTNSSVNASSEAVVGIKFDNSAMGDNYIVDIGTSSAGTELTVTDQIGNSIAEIPEIKNSYILKGDPNAMFYVKTKLASKVENGGGCCIASLTKSVRVDVNLKKAPLLFSKQKMTPYIIGGVQTSSYKNVGAILLNGRLHCTGTIIGPKTILTAAHCFYGYESQSKDFSFVIGPNIVQTSFGPKKVVSYVYPTGEDGYSFNRVSLEDDIALAYLESPSDIKPMLLHNGSPSWESILENKVNLTFVGFGFDKVDDELVASGIKREGSWHVDIMENRRVAFSVEGKNTCKGDSGGPAFLSENSKIMQVAVTSGGDTLCTMGYETRVDAYKSWLANKIQ